MVPTGVLAAAIGAPELLIILLNLAILVAVAFVAVKLLRWFGGADRNRVAQLEERVAELEDELEA